MLFFGKAKDPLAPDVFHRVSLAAFLAWVGLGSDGLSSSCYGPEEAFLALGSTHRVFAWCNVAVRAEPLPYGADDYVNLELYVAWCGHGLPVETPAVRR